MILHVRGRGRGVDEKPDVLLSARVFQLAAPHYESDGGTLNTGFFDFFVPDALIVLMGIADPSSVAKGSFTLTNSNGGTVKYEVEHDPVAGGARIFSTENFTYSAPTFTIKAKKCVVPNVVGKTQAAAVQALNKANCKAGKITKAFSDSVPKGKVISQAKEPGTELAKNAKVAKVDMFYPTGRPAACSTARSTGSPLSGGAPSWVRGCGRLASAATSSARRRRSGLGMAFS